MPSTQPPLSVHGSALDLSELLAQHGTPLYLYDAQRVREAWKRFRQAFPYQHTSVHYAIVCNKNPYLVRLLLDLGAGIHANTPGDAFAALAAGVPPERILYSGTNLDQADMEYLLQQGLPLILDSLDQLRLRARYGPGAVGLRLWLPEGAPRIGVDPRELPEALSIARAAGLTLEGLHMYTATNNRKVERFLAGLENMVEASRALPDLRYLDLGGGYGVDYRRHSGDLDLEALGQAVSSRMSELSQERGRPIELRLEPGRILVARSGSLLVRVVSLKEREGRRYVGVDSTVGNLVVESVYHPYHAIHALQPRGAELEIPTDVCGNTTHSRDYLARHCRLPRLEVGDVLVLGDVGAYGYAMSSHFLNRPRPPEVVLDQGRAILTTRRETLRDLLHNQVTL
jgi:diaminopimelate decarboxylase